MSTRTIDRIHNPTPELFRREYLEKNRPCIITGMASRWKAASWTPEYFKTSFPGIKLRYEIWEGDESINDPIDFERKQTYVTAPMADFIDKMQSAKEPSRKIYCAQFKIFDAIPQLWEEVESLEPYMGLPGFLPGPVRNMMKISPFFWMGPAGVLSTLHFDRSHNIFVQLYGRKKWILIPPEHSEHVYYPCADFSTTLLHMSPVDVEHPDLKKFPNYAKAEPIEVVVEPGEMLFNPTGWWHYVRALDPAISLNFFWQLPVADAVALRRYIYHMGRRQVLNTLGLQRFNPEFRTR